MHRRTLTGRLISGVALVAVSLSAVGCGAHRNATFRTTVRGPALPWTHERFDTASARFTFAVVSDLNGGERPGVFEVAAAQLSLLRPELVMSVGDLIDAPKAEKNALTKEWDDFDRRARMMPAPFFRVGGNHDLTGAELRSVWRSRYGPTWYAFVYKQVLFLVLDTEDLTPERAQQIFVARSRAIQADRDGRTDTDTMEYYRMPERVAGNIGDEQAAYVQRALRENPDVRWTFLFFHKPVWQSSNSPGFRAIETALVNRPYTVFSGHVHSFARTERNGREYYTLGTTGGSQNPKDPMSFDHLTLVTMTPEGPSITHLRMDGVLAPNGKIPRGGDTLCLQASRCAQRR